MNNTVMINNKQTGFNHMNLCFALLGKPCVLPITLHVVFFWGGN